MISHENIGKVIAMKLNRFLGKMMLSVVSVCSAVAALSMVVSAEGATTTTEGGTTTWTGMLVSLLPFVIAIFLLYLVMFRPQQKREKELQKMRDNVKVGDEISTAGGIVGFVVRVQDDTVVIETGGDRSKIRIKKWAIHENITQMEEQAAAEKARKAERQKGIATAAAQKEEKKKKKD